MGRFFLFLVRLVALAVAFGIACLVVACLQVLLNAAMVPNELADLHQRGVDLRLVIGLLGLAGLIAHAAFIPAAVLILVGEFARLRNWLIYALGGGVVAGIVLVMARRADVALAFDARHLAVDVVSAMLGGLAYWLIAGYRAGRWLPGDAERRRTA